MGLLTKLGDYCMVPQSGACSTRDGVCDEPKGTGQCLEGADQVDCCKRPAPGGECDPVSQCGCETKPGTQCHYESLAPMTTCQPFGTLDPGSVCNPTNNQCPQGYGCILNVCRKYCAPDVANSCGAGGSLCIPYNDKNGAALTGIGACYVACDYTKSDGCHAGTVCAQPQPSVAVCFAPLPNCASNYIGNGKCDDTRPGGTRLCAMGTDPDCT
jgi:hypothetical protein